MIIELFGFFCFDYQSFKIFNHITNITFLFYFSHKIVKTNHFAMTWMWTIDTTCHLNKSIRYNGLVSKIEENTKVSNVIEMFRTMNSQ